MNGTALTFKPGDRDGQRRRARVAVPDSKLRARPRIRSAKMLDRTACPPRRAPSEPQRRSGTASR